MKWLLATKRTQRGEPQPFGKHGYCWWVGNLIEKSTTFSSRVLFSAVSAGPLPRSELEFLGAGAGGVVQHPWNLNGAWHAVSEITGATPHQARIAIGS